MENRFDDLTKALAEGIPRRQALRRLGALFGGAVLGSLAFGGAARAAPKVCCVSYPMFGPPIYVCVDSPVTSNCWPVGSCKKCGPGGGGTISP